MRGMARWVGAKREDDAPLHDVRRRKRGEEAHVSTQPNLPIFFESYYLTTFIRFSFAQLAVIDSLLLSLTFVEFC